MKLVAHGGHCCGMRHIYCVYQPDTVLVAQPAVGPQPGQAQFIKDGVYQSEQFQQAYDAWLGNCNARGLYQGEVPKETALDRMKRILLFCEDLHKQRGIIEVVVAGRDGLGQAENWRPHLNKLGFKLVNESKNSTSPNTIYVWHYNTGVGNRKNLVPETAGEESAVETTQSTATIPPLTGTLSA